MDPLGPAAFGRRSCFNLYSTAGDPMPMTPCEPCPSSECRLDSCDRGTNAHPTGTADAARRAQLDRAQRAPLRRRVPHRDLAVAHSRRRADLGGGHHLLHPVDVRVVERRRMVGSVAVRGGQPVLGRLLAGGGLQSVATQCSREAPRAAGCRAGRRGDHPHVRRTDPDDPAHRRIGARTGLSPRPDDRGGLRRRARRGSAPRAGCAGSGDHLSRADRSLGARP